MKPLRHDAAGAEKRGLIDGSPRYGVPVQGVRKFVAWAPPA